MENWITLIDNAGHVNIVAVRAKWKGEVYVLRAWMGFEDKQKQKEDLICD